MSGSAEARDHSRDRDPVVLGLGARTSIGLTLAETAAAARGGIPGFARYGYLRRRGTGEEMMLALLPTLPADSFAPERMKALALAAADEALAPLAGLSLDAGLPLLLSVPAPRPGFPEGSGLQLAREIGEALPIEVDRGSSGVIDTGHEAGLALLSQAAELLAGGWVAACLVGGVESYKEIDTLHFIEAQGRLKGADDPDGIIPGEGSAFLLLTTRVTARALGRRPLAELRGQGRGQEPHPWYMGEPSRGDGLTVALRGALEGEGRAGPVADVTYADLNGERWRADEWGYAYLRTAGHLRDPLELHHPADCWGDVGAASGTLLAALAAHELGRPGGRGASALVWAAADTRPFRSACLLTRGEEA